MAERKTVTYRRVRMIGNGGEKFYKKRCGGCRYFNNLSSRVCRNCSAEMRKPPKRKKPERGSVERLRADLAHAAKKADEWMTRVKAATTNLHYWSRRERALAEKLADRRAAKPTVEIVRAVKFAQPKDG